VALIAESRRLGDVNKTHVSSGDLPATEAYAEAPQVLVDRTPVVLSECAGYVNRMKTYAG
jgi:hypothetical protein